MKKNSGKNLLGSFTAAEQLTNAVHKMSVTCSELANRFSRNISAMKGAKPVHTPDRTRLPDVRAGLTKKAQACGMEYYITVNFFPNSKQPAEVFCRIAKEGSTVAGFIEALMITISIAFQYGVPWDVLYNKYLHQIFEPKDDRNSSLVDAIGKTITETIGAYASQDIIGLEPVEQP